MPGCKAQNIQHRLAKWTGSHRLNHIHTKIDLPSLVLALQFADILGNEANWKWPGNAWKRPQANSLCNQHASSILLHHHYFPFGTTGSQSSCKTHSEKQNRKNTSRHDVVGLGITYEEQNCKQMVLPQEYPGEYGWTLNRTSSLYYERCSRTTYQHSVWMIWRSLQATISSWWSCSLPSQHSLDDVGSLIWPSTEADNLHSVVYDSCLCH